MGIGESLDLKKMLSVSVSRYLKELGCSMGAVLLTERDFSHRISFSVAYSIPRNFERSEGFKTLIEEVSNSKNIESDVVSGRIPEGFYYIMGLSDIGLLVLLKKDGELSDGIVEALQPLNKKLGEACRACLQNEKYQRSSSRFMEMANMLPAIIIELDEEYRLSYINKSTYEIFKQIDSDYFKPTSLFDFFPEGEKAKVRLLLDDAQTSRRMNSKDLWMENSRGERFPVQVLFSPIFHDSTIVGYRGIGIDISEKYQHQEEQRKLMDALSERLRELDCLYGITKVLSEHDNTLEKIFSTAVDIIPPSFELPDDTSARIIFSGKEYVSTTYTDISSGISYSSDIISNGERLGEVTVVKQTDEQFDVEELNLIDALGRQFSNIATTKMAEEEKNRLYQDLMDDMDTAQSVQSYLLPPWAAVSDDLIMSSIYSPSSKVGGDLFDILPLNDHSYMIYVGDISGHGVQAALTMTAVKSIVNMLIVQTETELTPSKILTQLNGILSKHLFHDNYMTMLLCIIDMSSHTLKSISAGHPQGFLIDGSRKSIRPFDDVGGIPLGWIDDYTYSEKDEFSTVFTADEIICLFTDGLFDAEAPDGSRIEDEGVRQILKTEVDLQNLFMLPYALKSRINDHTYNTSVDDFTFITFKENSSSAPCPSRSFQLQPVFAQTQAVAEECEQFVIEQIDDPAKGLFVKLIVNEFVNNVIEHGLKGTTDTIIQITLDLSDEITLTFRDKGRKWQMPERKDSFTDFFEEMNQEHATRGRGLQMIYSVTRTHRRKRVFDLNETVFILL
ncbi:MAG: SpoIIE family protein phosphatase [Spirochaetia bacterium]|nr:SpoIIE family protein phosphatase [Spirochaetia bacterium]MCF7942565.1 SpoIIE family protein phosphatase [Spirochaetia bacterium]